MPAKTVQAIFDGLADTMPGAIEVVCGKLPEDFPEQLRDSITGGVLTRLKQITAARAA